MRSVLQGVTLLSLVYNASCLMNRRADPSILCSSSRNPHPLMVSTIDRSSSRSSGTKSDDLFSQQVNSQRDPERAERRIRLPSAPRVDSALLRFLSTQKLQREARLPSDSEIEMLQAHAEMQRIEDERRLRWSPTVSYLDTLKALAEKGVPRAAGAKRKYLDALAATRRIEPAVPAKRKVILRSNDTTESWMGQYNANRVAKLLMANSVEEDDAMEAGVAVQSHVLARTARRRVREFLKRRDKLWVDSNNGTLLETPGGSVRPTNLGYGFEDVLQLLLENGLTGKDIAAILVHTPGVALMMPRRITDEGVTEDILGGETLEETIKRAYDGVLRESLELRKYDARKVLRTCPGLLTKRGSKKAQDVLILLTSLGVSKKSLARDNAALPILLSRSPADLFRFVAFLASDEVRMPVKNIGPLLRRSECVELLNAVAPISGFDITDSHGSGEEYGGVGDTAVASALWGRRGEVRRERINEIFRTMSKTARILKNEIGTQDLGKVIAAYPAVLLLDAETQILPCADYLMEELGVCQDDLPSVLQLYPVLLGTPLSQLQRVVRFLKSLEVDDDNLASIFRAFPSLLTMDIEQQMIPVIHFLQEIGIANLGRFITRLPPVLGYSVERELRPKWDYLSKVCLFPSFELSTFPAYFSYPLDRVIKARYEYLYEVKRTPTQLLALDVVLRYGDKDFAGQVANDDDRGVAFAAFLEGRKKREGKKVQKKGGKTKKPDEGPTWPKCSPKVYGSSVTEAGREE